MICLSLAEKKLVQDWSFWMKALVMGLLAKYAVAVVFQSILSYESTSRLYGLCLSLDKKSTLSVPQFTTSHRSLGVIV